MTTETYKPGGWDLKSRNDNYSHRRQMVKWFGESIADLNSDTALPRWAEETHKAVLKTDQSQMGFTRSEVIKINEALWQYELTLNDYARKHGKEAAYARHEALDDEIKKNVNRAFIMMKRTIKVSIEAKDRQSMILHFV